MQSAGEVTTRLVVGSAIGRSPPLISRAMNWLAVSHPLGAFGAPSTSDSWMRYSGALSMNDCRASGLNDSGVSRKFPHCRAKSVSHSRKTPEPWAGSSPWSTRK
ncbi:hypothetical protein [Mycobacterium intracellulare]|uniref:Uncharacterized protein n=1 Tax=Mycobacterium intracellulare subsp. chimaera TaxID=222805 RepID=A0ABT7NWP2_MYCIT|nr:hypothetical protein [Mycobacterium intracellulare]MCF1811783.1 hypothetical protein [Mycobacterium intracellulare subsp. intracellulare]MDM3925446.1 hypothetical protein [Mycobacterium intracellulare subsp. chimaera]MDS0334841.1 hypothetical protein [Mycobacterium intracellulare]